VNVHVIVSFEHFPQEMNCCHDSCSHLRNGHSNCFTFGGHKNRFMAISMLSANHNKPGICPQICPCLTQHPKTPKIPLLETSTHKLSKSSTASSQPKSVVTVEIMHCSTSPQLGSISLYPPRQSVTSQLQRIPFRPTAVLSQGAGEVVTISIFDGSRPSRTA